MHLTHLYAARFIKNGDIQLHIARMTDTVTDTVTDIVTDTVTTRM